MRAMDLVEMNHVMAPVALYSRINFFFRTEKQSDGKNCAPVTLERNAAMTHRIINPDARITDVRIFNFLCNLITNI